MRIDLFKDGKAVRRSIQRTNSLFFLLVREWIRANKVDIASAQPVSGRNPNCSLPACHRHRIRWSTTCPNHAAKQLSSRIPRKLLGRCLGFPGFRRDLMRAMPKLHGYTAQRSITEKSSATIGTRQTKPGIASAGIPSLPGDLPGRRRLAAAPASASVTGSAQAESMGELRISEIQLSASLSSSSLQTDSFA